VLLWGLQCEGWPLADGPGGGAAAESAVGGHGGCGGLLFCVAPNVGGRITSLLHIPSGVSRITSVLLVSCPLKALYEALYKALL